MPRYVVEVTDLKHPLEMPGSLFADATTARKAKKIIRTRLIHNGFKPDIDFIIGKAYIL